MQRRARCESGSALVIEIAASAAIFCNCQRIPSSLARMPYCTVMDWSTRAVAVVRAGWLPASPVYQSHRVGGASRDKSGGTLERRPRHPLRRIGGVDVEEVIGSGQSRSRRQRRSGHAADPRAQCRLQIGRGRCAVGADGEFASGRRRRRGCLQSDGLAGSIRQIERKPHGLTGARIGGAEVDRNLRRRTGRTGNRRAGKRR